MYVKTSQCFPFVAQVNYGSGEQPVYQFASLPALPDNGEMTKKPTEPDVKYLFSIIFLEDIVPSS